MFLFLKHLSLFVNMNTPKKPIQIKVRLEWKSHQGQHSLCAVLLGLQYTEFEKETVDFIALAYQLSKNRGNPPKSS